MKHLVKKTLELMLALTVIGYIGINFVAQLPTFLIGENLAYAIMYSVLLYLILIDKFDKAKIPLAIVLSFNLGRVSRSIIEPSGSLHPLAMAHIPLMLVLVLNLALTLIYGYIKGRS